MPYPKAIANAPVIELAEVFYYTAFIDLATCRLYEGGPIPYFAVADYAASHGLGDEEAEALGDVITTLDAKFREWWKAEHKET